MPMPVRAKPYPARRVRVIGAGGTIGMNGSGGARPELEAEALVASVPGLAGHEGLETAPRSPTSPART